jgi:hypothetical protein
MPETVLTPDIATSVNDAALVAVMNNADIWSVKLESGNWPFSAHLLPKPGLRIHGDAPFGTVMVAQGGDACIEFSTPTSSGYIGGGVERVQFDANYAADCPLRFGKSNKYVCRDVRVIHAVVDAVRLWGAQNMDIRNLLIETCNGDGVDGDWGLGGCVLTNMDIRDVGGWCININSTAGYNGSTSEPATNIIADSILEGLSGGNPNSLGGIRVGTSNRLTLRANTFGFGSLTHAADAIKVDKDRSDMVTNHISIDQCGMNISTFVTALRTAAGTITYINGQLVVTNGATPACVNGGTLEIYGIVKGNTSGFPARIP